MHSTTSPHGPLQDPLSHPLELERDPYTRAPTEVPSANTNTFSIVDDTPPRPSTTSVTFRTLCAILAVLSAVLLLIALLVYFFVFHNKKSPTTHSDMNTFLAHLKIHKVGVLEASNGAGVRPGSCIMDPAGKTYMLNGLGGAGGASGAIYAYFGLTTVANEVQQAFRTFAGTAGFAKMHMYTQTELGKHKEMAPVGIIHTVGPNGSQVPDFNTFKDILIDAYMYALKEYFSHGDQCTELRMLPVSMGIFAHSDIRGNAKKQAKVTIECLARALERVLTDTPTLNEMITRNPIGLYLLGGTGVREYEREVESRTKG